LLINKYKLFLNDKEKMRIMINVSNFFPYEDNLTIKNLADFQVSIGGFA